KNPGKWVSSDWIARSVQINPVIVRKELSVLQEKGWVISKKGKEGGSMLHVSSDEISLAEIYKAVRNSNILGKKNPCANTACSIGKKINKELESLFAETDDIVFDTLQHRTLRSFAEQFD